MLLTMGDGQVSAGGKSLIPGDRAWGVGRLHARMWNGAGLDNPYSWRAGLTCVGQGETVIIPVTGTPDASGAVDIITAAIYWYDVRHETGSAIDNINLTLGTNGNGSIRSSSHPTNEYEVVRARQGHGGTDNIRGFPVELWISGVSVTADNAGCGQNMMLVYYAFLLEDNDRDDPEGPSIVTAVRE